MARYNRKRMGVRRPRAVRKGVRRPRAVRKGGRRLPGAGAAAGIIGYVGYRAYKSRQGYLAAVARANKARMARNIEVSKNIVKIPAGITFGSYSKPTLSEKIHDELDSPIMFRQTHAYKVNGDGGRMNWFSMNSLPGGVLTQYVNKVKDSASDATTADTNITDPTVAIGSSGVPQQFYKYDIKYHSVQYQLVNSSTNSLQGVIMWLKPKRELKGAFDNTTTPIAPCNIFALACNASQPTQSAYNPSNFTQGNVSNGMIFTSTQTGLDYNRAGNAGTINNSTDSVLETDVGLKPTSAICKGYFDYYFDIVKSTDFDLSPGQQTEFWLKQYDRRLLDFQALQYSSIPNITMYCMIGFKGQMVGTSATTGDVNLVSTGSAQLSIIETQKTLMKPVTVHAPKIWNFTADTTDPGYLSQIADASQEIINDETDGVDNTYNEVV